MKKLQANNKKNAYAKVDDDIFEIIQEMKLKFYIKKDGYWLSTTLVQLPYMTEKKRLLLHRFVYIIKTGEESTSTVDHIDFNPANNMFSNLRLASRREQQQHRSKRNDNKSGFVGVCYQHRVGKHYKNGYIDYWKASICKPDGKLKQKYFPYDEAGKIAAAKYYDKKASEYFGNFCGQLNFPDENK